jgi:hypothetical protein
MKGDTGKPTSSEDTLPLRISLGGLAGAGLLGVCGDIGEASDIGLLSSRDDLASKNSSNFGRLSVGGISPIKTRASRLVS